MQIFSQKIQLIKNETKQCWHLINVLNFSWKKNWNKSAL